MISRAQLEEQLAQQRARRASTKRPTPRKGGNWMGVLVVLAILSSSGAAFAYIVSAPTSDAIMPVVTKTILPSVSPSIRLTHTPVTSPIPATLQVCTNIPEGRLHVRFAAGEGSEVRGYLAEGETVQAAAGSQTIRGELWLRLSAPIAGWVNAHYLCEKGSSK